MVYFEIDSFLPVREEFEFLRNRSYKKSELLGEGFRLRTMTMRGELSQGLIMPLDAVKYYGAEEPIALSVITVCDGESTPRKLKEGDDVSVILGVKEWQIPEMATSGGTIIGQASTFISVTDETRVQSLEGLFEEFKGKPYYITTKLDGSSHSVCIDHHGNFHVFGHNYEYKDDGKSMFYEYVKKHEVELLIRKYMTLNDLTSMIVQGEWCGAGIQKNRLQLKQPKWFFFTVDENERRAGLEEMKRFWQFCVDEGRPLDIVPVVETGEDLLSKYKTVDELLERAGEDTSRIYNGGEPEGIVIRPKEPVFSKLLRGPLSMKVINNRYLLKNKE